MKITTNSVAETKRLGHLLIEAIILAKGEVNNKESFTIVLVGDLAGGKPLFCKDWLRDLKLKGKF